MSVELNEKHKGTHMSRFLEILNDWQDRDILGSRLDQILYDMNKKLKAKTSHINFRLFLTMF